MSSAVQEEREESMTRIKPVQAPLKYPPQGQQYPDTQPRKQNKILTSSIDSVVSSLSKDGQG